MDSTNLHYPWYNVNRTGLLSREQDILLKIVHKWLNWRCPEFSCSTVLRHLFVKEAGATHDIATKRTVPVRFHTISWTRKCSSTSTVDTRARSSCVSSSLQEKFFLMQQFFYKSKKFLGQREARLKIQISNFHSFVYWRQIRRFCWP